jgi:hypothetical protein
MVVYNVTVNIDSSVHDEWLAWMKEVHVPDVMNTGMFIESKILKVLGDEESGGSTYSFQYTCKSMNEFRQYEEVFAPALRAEVNQRYKDKFVAFRTLLEVVK